MGRLLFLCSGNYYRSRLAEMLFNFYAERAGLGWTAESRGLATVKHLKGLSPVAEEFLDRKGLKKLAEGSRDPITLSPDDFPQFDLVVVLNREEHLPIMERRFNWMVKALQKDARLILWNVHDIPIEHHPVLALVGWKTGRVGQAHESATEHIDFGVRALVYDLLASQPPR